MSEIMTPDNTKWIEFCKRLSGPGFCDFAENREGKTTWRCDGSTERPFASFLLREMDCDVEASLDYFEEHGGYCDCEILFNVDPG